jgi:hypothetical protein
MKPVRYVRCAISPGRVRGKLLGYVRHDLSHFHCLAGRHLLNAKHDLVVRGPGGLLQQIPDALEQPTLVFGRAADSNE